MRQAIIEFLRTKKILHPTATMWIMSFKDRKDDVDIIDLFAEYVESEMNSKKEEIKTFHRSELLSAYLTGKNDLRTRQEGGIGRPFKDWYADNYESETYKQNK